MLRIKMSLLEFKNNHFYYNDTFFNGIAYKDIEDSISEIGIYHEGVRVCEYNSKYYSFDGKCIDASCLTTKNDNDFPPFFYNGDNFSGTSIEFENSICVKETSYCNGFPLIGVSWFATGNIEELKIKDIINDVNFIQHYIWTTDGNFVDVEYFNEENFRFELSFSDEHKIQSLTIDGNFFEKITNFTKDIKYSPILKKDDVKYYSASSFLFLAGKDIDDDIFSNIQFQNGLSETDKLTLSHTSLTDKTFLALARLQNLKDIDVTDKREETSKILEKLKSMRSDFNILFNDNYI